MMKKKAQSMGDEFAANLQRSSSELEAAAPAGARPLPSRCATPRRRGGSVCGPGCCGRRAAAHAGAEQA